MRLLFLTPQIPYPPHQGTTARNFNIIRNLAHHHEISVLSFGTSQEIEAAKPLLQACFDIKTTPPPLRSTFSRALSTAISPKPDMALRLFSDSMRALVHAALSSHHYDLVQVEGIEMAPCMVYARQQHPRVKWVYDNHNAEYVLQRTAFLVDARHLGKWHRALYSAIQWRKLFQYEGKVCRMADHVFAASSRDAQAIQQLLVRRITVVPNGVDTEYFRPSDQVCAKPLAEFAMVFAGKMDYRPNIDAMQWFCADILPRIRGEYPLAHLEIVGQKPTHAVGALANRQGVEVTGWVPDTRPYVADAAVFVVPLRMGSGTRLKVLEAMAMGKAIVSTSLGVEGISLVPGKHVVIADSGEEFARSVAMLLQNERYRYELGSAARELALAYDWSQIVPLIQDAYAGLGAA